MPTHRPPIHRHTVWRALAKGWCPHGPLAALLPKEHSSPPLPSVPGWSAGPVPPKSSPEPTPHPAVCEEACWATVHPATRQRGCLGAGGHQDLHSGAELKTETGSRTVSRTE